MKSRGLIGIILVLVLMLSACSSIGLAPSDTIETLADWSFQYNGGTKDYSLFFALRNDKGENVVSDATVDIKIVNAAEEIVFEGTKNITESDFGYYTSQNEGERFLANLRIPESELSPGKSADGTIYFTVHKDGVFLFDECNCKILYSLPTKDFSIIAENLPTEVTVNSYDGSVQSKITISSVDCQVDEGILPTVTVVISGEKTYGSGSSMYDMFNYKLYDSEGYMVKSGTIFLDSLDVGDKFRDDSLLLYDIIPGEQYMKENWKYRRGDIYLVDLGTNIGSEQSGCRPALVLQNDVGNYYGPTLIVAPITSHFWKKANQPTHYLIEGAKSLNSPSVVLAEQLITIDKVRVKKYLGKLPEEQMQCINQAVKVSLGLE